ncbi:hypothetical protein IAR55_002249 [Kwoniella newhampshirensis]|uniref:Uncharacterized protein n=1 Tax=Kwoniella newhampshirensis TaxID=1651941 RepID=A0AAW0Z0D9_9TREE
MDRQLKSPLLIETIGKPTKLSSKDTFAHLQNFLSSLPACPSRTQLERLTDALGVEIGSILPAEGERREAERVAARSEARAERRRLREIEEEERKKEEMDGMVEDLEEDDVGEGEQEEQGGDGELENGAVEIEGEEQMDDRGDVEYGDVVDEDEDEPDNEDTKMEEDDD